MSSITPTIGRKVWYYEGKPPFAHDLPVGCNSDSQAFDATVIYVWGPSMVNLLVVRHDGAQYVETSVSLRDPSPSDRHGVERIATWMPYQVGQAKA